MRIGTIIAVFSWTVFISAKPNTHAASDNSQRAEGDGIEYTFLSYERSFNNEGEWLRLDAEARAFIWQHWWKRDRALLKATSYSVEGDAKTTRYLIEPGQDGAWCIRICEEHDLTSIRKKPIVEIRDLLVSNVERLVRRRDGRSQRIDDNDEIASDTYRLIFKDRKGDLVGEW